MNITTKLRRLCLKNCEFKNWQLDFFERLTDLEELDFSISYSRHSSIELNLSFQSLSHLKNLKYLCLYFGCNQFVLESLDFLNEMTQLVFLELNGAINCPIEEHKFKSLKHLEGLKIKNTVSTQCNGCCKCGHSEKMIKEGAEVLKSGAFKELKQLNSLVFHFPIRKIEETAFEGLECLTELDIKFDYNCSLKSPNLFKRLCCLKWLSIRNDNKYACAMDIDSDFLSNLTNLLCLTLNRIKGFKLTKDTFSKNESLQKLDMIGCDIKILPDNVFANLNNLMELSLRCNKLEALNENSFNGLDNLKELDLWINSFNEFNMNILPKLPKLESMTLPFSESAFNRYLDIELINTQFPNLRIRGGVGRCFLDDLWGGSDSSDDDC